VSVNSGYESNFIACRLGQNPFLTHIHVKEHKNTQAPSSLFVAGLPLGCGKKTLSHIVSCFGETTQIVLHSNKVREAEKMHAPPLLQAQLLEYKVC